ncbi:hypothetical protein KUCAC02_032457, partial [Chaenocephalus aceratus]
MEARRGVLVFSTFGKTRKITITKEVLLAVTDKLRATTKTKDNDEVDAKATFWGEVCQELGISDSKTNRTWLHHAYNHHKKMRHKTQMVTAAPASPSTDSDHMAFPIDSDHSSTDIDRTVLATPSSVTQAFTETSEPEDVSECNSSGTYDSSSHSKDGCREDIVYVDATGSIVKIAKGKTSPFYVYEMVVRNPFKGSSPVPVATYITNDHTTASIYFFPWSMAYNFCGVSLQELLSMYYSIVTGQAKHDCIRLPIMHRCLSHVMKNAKDLCRKHAAKHYHLAMHVFGLMTQATTMSELDEVVTSAVVVFSSSHSDRNVGKHFENLQGLLTNSAQSNLDDSTIVEDCVNDIGPTPFKQHFEDLITQTVIEKSGDDNITFCPWLVCGLAYSWVTLDAMDRDHLSKTFPEVQQCCKKPHTELHRGQQNSRDNGKKPVGPQKDPFSTEMSDQAGRFRTYSTYKVTLSALLRKYGDSLKRGRRPIVQHKKNLMQKTKTAKAPAPLQKQAPGETEAHIPSQDPKDKARQGQSSSTSDMTEHAEDDAQGGKVDASSELTALWEKKDTEVVIIECLFHIHAHKCELGTRIYILNHYSAGVILFGKREEVRKHTLSKIHFDSYGAIVSFVHVDGVHWTFLYINAEESTVYLAESDNAANKFSCLH